MKHQILINRFMTAVAAAGLITLESSSFGQDHCANLREAFFEDYVYGQLDRLQPNSYGIALPHLESIRTHCRSEKMLLILRHPNVAATTFHGKAGFRSKPVEVKIKTQALGQPNAGLVMRPGKFATRAELMNADELLMIGWKFDADGVLCDPAGLRIYGDYDIQGAYISTSDGSFTNAARALGERTMLEQLNRATGETMFNHGANDDYLANERSTTKFDAWNLKSVSVVVEPGTPLRHPNQRERFVAVWPEGKIELIDGKSNLQRIYNRLQIPWPY